MLSQEELYGHPVIHYNKGWYALKLLLSGTIAALSLAENSKEGVIGMMLVSPLGVPIVGSVLSLFIADWAELAINLATLITSLGTAILCGYAVGYFYRDREPTAEMRQRYAPVALGTFVAADLIGIVTSSCMLSFGGNDGFGTVELIGAGRGALDLPLAPLVDTGLTLANPRSPCGHARNSMLLALVNVAGIAVGTVIMYGGWYVVQIIRHRGT